MNPFGDDYTSLSIEELLDKNKELTQKLYAVDSSSPIYDQLVNMRDILMLEYNERLQIQAMKSKKATEVIEIGGIASTTYEVDYRDDATKFIHSVVDSYKDKDE